MRSRTPIELPTDADQLALMSSFHMEASFLPILQWIHGDKVIQGSPLALLVSPLAPPTPLSLPQRAHVETLM